MLLLSILQWFLIFSIGISLFHQVLLSLIIGFSAILNTFAELRCRDTWKTTSSFLCSLSVTDGSFKEDATADKNTIDPEFGTSGPIGMVGYAKNIYNYIVAVNLYNN